MEYISQDGPSRISTPTVTPAVAPGPIDFLPIELLVEIFTFCSHSEALSLIRLSSTRRFWSEVRH